MKRAGQWSCSNSGKGNTWNGLDSEVVQTLVWEKYFYFLQILQNGTGALTPSNSVGNIFLHRD